jgi:hypothetical protein
MPCNAFQSDASQLVGCRSDYYEDGRPLLQTIEPWAERGALSLEDDDG